MGIKLRAHSTRSEDGQALVEFALSLPILVFFIMGVIDFGVILFSYSHSSNSLRNALRSAEVIGYRNTSAIPPYLDCATMINKAADDWFGVKQDIDISYIKADGSHAPYTCADVNANPGVLVDGDILHIHLLATVDPLFLPIGKLNIEFDGERSLIVSEIKVAPVDSGPGGGGDPSVVIPPAPFNFAANEDCTTGNVSFTWQWGTTSPMPTRAEIRDVGDDSVVVNITDTSSTTCTNCDTISIPVGGRSYYIVAYNGTGANEKVSPASSPDPAACTAEPPVQVPPAPTNFATSINCATGQVSFGWNWGTTSPMPTRAEIRSATDNSVRVSITDTSSTTCTDCDTIPVPGSWGYYIVAYNGTGFSEKVSAPSTSDSVVCQAVAPPAPTSFLATESCVTGNVSFSWVWGSTSPMPTRAEIRDASDNSVVVAINTISGTTCTDCDTISTSGGNRTYYIVAYNGSGASESVASASSNTDPANCAAPTGGTLIVVLRDEPNKNKLCNYGSATYTGSTIRAVGVGFDTTLTTTSVGGLGTATFTNVPPGNYTITIPSSFPGSPKNYLPNSAASSSACKVNSLASYTDTGSPSITTVTAGATTTVTFGYAQKN